MSSPHIRNFLTSPLRSFCVIWVPVLFSMVAEPLTGLVDTAFIARLGTEHLAALGVGTVVLTSGLWLFNFLSVGSQTEVSQASGKNDLSRGRRFGSLALLLAAAIGIATGFVALLLAPQIASLMGAEGNVLEYAITYIRLRAFGGPAVLLSMTSFGILYGLGDMRSPLRIALLVNGLNILLDWLLIFGVGPFPALGIAGGAIATAVSQWCGAIWCLVKVRQRIGMTRKIETEDVRKLLKIGRDMFLRTGSLILFLLLATRLATRLSVDTGAAHQAVRQVWVFTNLFLDAAAVTAQSVVGYFFGAGNKENGHKAARLVCLLGTLVGIFLMAAMIAGSSSAAALFMPSTGETLFIPAWTIAALLQPIAALAFVTDGIHWGTGDFTFLRNAVILATLCGTAAIILLDLSGSASLAAIWWITGFWVLIRAIFGILRLWPGIGHAPLGKGSYSRA